MKFAKILFSIAGIWGLLSLTPLYFLFNVIPRRDPPPITHPGFYYGFAAVALAWQLAFFVIATNPVRFRPIMIPAMFEKFGWGCTVIVLRLQHRISSGDMNLGLVDIVFGLLFIAAFTKTPSRATT